MRFLNVVAHKRFKALQGQNLGIHRVETVKLDFVYAPIQLESFFILFNQPVIHDARFDVEQDSFQNVVIEATIVVASPHKIFMRFIKPFHFVCVVYDVRFFAREQIHNHNAPISVWCFRKHFKVIAQNHFISSSNLLFQIPTAVLGSQCCKTILRPHFGHLISTVKHMSIPISGSNFLQHRFSFIGVRSLIYQCLSKSTTKTKRRAKTQIPNQWRKTTFRRLKQLHNRTP